MQKIFRLRWSLLNVLTYDMFLRFCHSRVTIDHYSFFSGLQEPEHVHSNSGAYGRNAQRFLVDDMARKEPRDRHGNKPGRARQDKIREVLAWRPRHIRLRASFADRRGTHGRLRGPIVCPATGLSKSELKLREKLFCWSPPRVYWHSVNLELNVPCSGTAASALISSFCCSRLCRWCEAGDWNKAVVALSDNSTAAHCLLSLASLWASLFDVAELVWPFHFVDFLSLTAERTSSVILFSARGLRQKDAISCFMLFRWEDTTRATSSSFISRRGRTTECLPTPRVCFRMCEE